MYIPEQQLEAIRASIRRSIDDWAFELSDWEARIVSEIEALPAVTVHRAHPPIWAAHVIRQQYCHHNTHWFARNDPTRSATVVAGWAIDPSGNYPLHSVLRIGAGYQCMTTVMDDARTSFRFIPDPGLEASFDGREYRFTRDGREVGVGVRRDPAATLAELRRIAARLDAGVDPRIAVRRDEEVRTFSAP